METKVSDKRWLLNISYPYCFYAFILGIFLPPMINSYWPQDIQLQSAAIFTITAMTTLTIVLHYTILHVLAFSGNARGSDFAWFFAVVVTLEFVVMFQLVDILPKDTWNFALLTIIGLCFILAVEYHIPNWPQKIYLKMKSKT